MHNSTTCYGNECAMPFDWNGDPCNIGVALPDFEVLCIMMDHSGNFSTNIAHLDHIMGDNKPIRVQETSGKPVIRARPPLQPGRPWPIATN